MCLLEAAADNKDASYLVPADRFTLAFKEPTLNWGYKTVPQKKLKGQEIDYSRGKGLGGSTAINFSYWVVGADEDFNECVLHLLPFILALETNRARWARKVGDDAWTWKNVKQRFKKIESYHVEIPEEHKKYINSKSEDESFFLLESRKY